MSQTAAVILAAGSSRRFGGPKQDALFGGVTLLDRAVQVAIRARFSPVLVVIRDQARAESLRQLGAEPLLNAHALEGMASSIRLGIAAAQRAGVAGAVVMACDQPLLQPEHLVALCREALRTTASSYAGRKGVPAYFPASAFPELLALAGDAGARDLLRSAEAIPDESLALDIDTVEDLYEAERRLGR